MYREPIISGKMRNEDEDEVYCTFDGEVGEAWLMFGRPGPGQNN